MFVTLDTQRLETVWALETATWERERFHVTGSNLQALAEAFPGEATHPDATHPIDLDALNRKTHPLGFLVGWEPEGLLVFRIGP